MYSNGQCFFSLSKEMKLKLRFCEVEQINQRIHACMHAVVWKLW